MAEIPLFGDEGNHISSFAEIEGVGLVEHALPGCHTPDSAIRGFLAILYFDIDVWKFQVCRKIQRIDDILTERFFLFGENRLQFEVVGGKVQIRPFGTAEFIRWKVDGGAHSSPVAAYRIFFFI